MGLDTIIYFEHQNGDQVELEGLLPDGFKIEKLSKWEQEDCAGATHEIDTLYCFYDEDYERGPWPQIAATLMTLLATNTIGRVWYGCSPENPSEMTPERINELNTHYMTHGHRPYITEPIEN